MALTSLTPPRIRRRPSETIRLRFKGELHNHKALITLDALRDLQLGDELLGNLVREFTQ